MKASIAIGDRVTFPASPTSVTRYVGTVLALESGCARIEVEGYGANHVSTVRLPILRHASQGLTPTDAWQGKL